MRSGETLEKSNIKNVLRVMLVMENEEKQIPVNTVMEMVEYESVCRPFSASWNKSESVDTVVELARKS